MVELGVMFGVMIALAVFLIVKLLRRGNRATENADGLLIEQDRRLRAHHDRASYNAMSMDGTSPTQSDGYRRP
ncbi:hypothetical protein U5640_29745 [Streptomyces sp. SS7]|uniref:hypothetical protein n=1 Tax=Streptomyces sp. SS7 TaxID=3108485 RepID=UPI0030EB9B67